MDDAYERQLEAAANRVQRMSGAMRVHDTLMATLDYENAAMEMEAKTLAVRSLSSSAELMYMTARCEELAAQTSLTAQEMTELDRLLQILNERMPGLSAYVDEQSGALRTLAGGLYETVDAYYAAAEAQAMYAAYEKLLGQTAEEILLARIDYESLGRRLSSGQYNTGVSMGITNELLRSYGQLAEKEARMQRLLEQMAALDRPATGDNSAAIRESSARTATATARAAEKLEIVEEELQYFRDAAEREAINRFTTAQIAVNLGGITQNVSDKTDLDGLVNYLEQALLESMESAAEGVYGP